MSGKAGRSDGYAGQHRRASALKSRCDIFEVLFLSKSATRNFSLVDNRRARVPASTLAYRSRSTGLRSTFGRRLPASLNSEKV
jgi:hypothetical protein